MLKPAEKNGMKNYHILILILDYGERFLKITIELYSVYLDKVQSGLYP